MTEKMKRRPISRRDQKELVKLLDSYLGLVLSDYCYGNNVGGGQLEPYTRGVALRERLKEKGW